MTTTVAGSGKIAPMTGLTIDICGCTAGGVTGASTFTETVAASDFRPAPSTPPAAKVKVRGTSETGVRVKGAVVSEPTTEPFALKTTPHKSPSGSLAIAFMVSASVETNDEPSPGLMSNTVGRSAFGRDFADTSENR